MVDENAPLTKTSLINKTTLIVLCISVVALLLILLPNQEMLLGHLDDSNEPEVAIAFLEALEKQNEADLPIILSLAINYNKAGRHQDVLDSVIPFEKFKSEENQWTAKKLFADSSLKLIGQSPSNKQKLTKDLKLFINQLHSIPTKDLARTFADIAVQVGEPQSSLAILKQYKDQGIAKNAEFINLALQSGDIDYALELQEIEYEKDPNVESLSKLLDLYLATSLWQKGEDAILAFDEGQNLPEEYFASSINFLLSGGRLGFASSLAAKRAELYPSEFTVEHASRLFAQKGDIKSAVKFLEKAIEFNEKESYLVTLHQYNRWIGDPKEALRITHLLEKFELNEKQIRAGIEEANAVSSLTSLSHFYHMLGQKGLLLVNEYDKWLTNAEKALGVPKVIEQLESLVKNAEATSPLYQQLAKFYYSMGEFEKVGKLWNKVGNIAPLSFRDVNYYADAYKKMWQPEKSLEVLTSVDDFEKSDEKYLEKVSKLAWYVSDKPILKKVYKLRKAESISPYQFIKLHSPIEMDNSQVFYDFYKDTGKLEVLTAFAGAAFTQNNDEKFTEALNIAHQHEGELPSAFLVLKAQHAIKNNVFDDAYDYLTQVLTTSENNEAAVSNLLWLNIQNKDNEALSTVYQKYKKPLAQSNQMWSTFAAAANTLGLYEESKVWYIKKIGSDKKVPAELLDFANVLDTLGDGFSANIIRKHVATHLTTELFKLPNGDRTYRSLASIFIGESIASAMVEKALKDNPSEDKAKELLTYHLADEDHEKARALLSSNWLKQYNLPDNEALKLALLERNPMRVMELVNNSLFLTPAERVAALNKIGEKKLAWETGISLVEESAGTNQHPQLLNQLISLHTERVYALRVDHKNFSQWDVSQNEVGYYQPYGNGFVRFFARQMTSDVRKGVLKNQDFEANQLEGRYGFTHDTLKVDITALLDHRFKKTTIGAQIKTTYKVSRYLSLMAQLSKNMKATSSKNMLMFGKQDAITASVFLSPTRREMISAQLSYQKYKTIFGDEIANNLSISIKAQEAIFYNDPSWTAYAQYVYEKADKSNVPLHQLSEHLALGQPINANGFIADKYQQIMVGQRFSHGATGVPGVKATYPSYWVDTSLGYNFEQDKVVFDIAAGIGMPIFGNDELYMSTLWQSTDKTGEKNLNLSLGYYLTF